MPKIVLTDEVRAQILAGSNEIDLPEPTPAAGAPAASPAPAPVAAAPAPVPTAAAPAAAPAAAAPSADLVAHLNATIAAKDALLVDATVKIRNLEAAAADGTALVPELLKIAQASCARMQVALGVADTSSALSAKAAVEEHAKLMKPYTEKFPVGGVGARGNTTDPAAETAQTEAQQDFRARLSLVAQQRA
jgi:hypothetical protein